MKIDLQKPRDSRGMAHVRVALIVLITILAAGVTPGQAAQADSPILVRAHNFVVNPSTGPVTYVSVKNAGDKPFSGVLKATFPDGWKATQSQHEISLKPDEMRKYPFAIEKASEDMKNNRYPIEITVEGGGQMLKVKQDAVWTSAPYFKPKIDGKTKEWKDAVPIAFQTESKKTVVRLYWNKKQFCLLVEVEEEDLVGLKKSSSKNGMDAVQFAISPTETRTGDKASDKSQRCEFLIADSGKRFGSDSCFVLMQPGNELGVAEKGRALEPLVLEGGMVVVKRSGSITTYEAAIPFKAVPGLKPTAGREYCFSLLVHDPDGTGVRDLGSIMNLWEAHRKQFGWCSWENVKWGEKLPFDNKVEFGFCSSIH